MEQLAKVPTRGDLAKAALGIGAVSGRRQRQATARGEIGVMGEKGGHLILILLSEQRASSVDQTPADANQSRGLVQDRGLLGHEFGEILLTQAPPRVRVTPPGAGSGAGCVDQNSVETPGAALGFAGLMLVKRRCVSWSQ